MKNRNSTLYLVSGISGIIFGILYCITLIGIFLGIPIIIGATKYFKWNKMSDEEMQTEKDSVVIWGVVFAIFTFPVGLIALAPIFNFDGQLSNAVSSKPKLSVDEVMDEKINKINKLHEMKEKGIIDEEDFKRAKEKILTE